MKIYQTIYYNSDNFKESISLCESNFELVVTDFNNFHNNLDDVYNILSDTLYSMKSIHIKENIFNNYDNITKMKEIITYLGSSYINIITPHIFDVQKVSEYLEISPSNIVINAVFKNDKNTRKYMSFTDYGNLNVFIKFFEIYLPFLSQFYIPYNIKHKDLDKILTVVKDNDSLINLVIDNDNYNNIMHVNELILYIVKKVYIDKVNNSG